MRVSDLDRLIREEASSVAESDVAAQPATAATETPAKDPDQEEKLAKKKDCFDRCRSQVLLTRPNQGNH